MSYLQYVKIYSKNLDIFEGIPVFAPCDEKIFKNYIKEKLHLVKATTIITDDQSDQFMDLDWLMGLNICLRSKRFAKMA